METLDEIENAQMNMDLRGMQRRAAWNKARQWNWASVKDEGVQVGIHIDSIFI